MPRPWNKIVVESDQGVGEVLPDGRILAGVNVAMSDDDVEAIRQGYKCINCWENLDSGWPEECFVCGFPIRAQQAERFEHDYAGWAPDLRTGPNWERLADQLEERAERRAFEERAEKSGISLGLRGISIPKALPNPLKGRG